jgi:branched-chain amino acid transport system permease protein
VQIAILAICLGLMASLAILVYRTPLGTAMRATAQNAQVAGLMGIDVNRIIAVTFIIGAGLGAVAGVLFGTYYGLAQYTMGSVLGLKAFSAAVLGGIGNIPGAMLGRRAARAGRGARRRLHRRFHRSVPVGTAARRVRGGGHFILVGSNYQDVFAFIVLILVLVFRPQGLLGERVGDRA